MERPLEWGIKAHKLGEFPGGLVIRTLGFHCRGRGSIPGLGTEIPASHAAQQNKQTKQQQQQNPIN